jgi:hypothetical protein
MSSLKQQKFYVGLLMRDGQIAGHRVSQYETKFDPPKEAPEQNEVRGERSSKVSSVPRHLNFKTVYYNLVSTLESYRSFMPFLTGNLVPKITRIMGEREIGQFVKKHGFMRADLSTDGREVYKLDQKLFGEIMSRTEMVKSAVRGGRMLPEVVVVGLISAYDGFLSSLLRVVIDKHPEIVLTSQKELTFKELLEFRSIEEARSTLIEREIESVIRKSHHEQFDWMEKHLDVPLRKGLAVWPKFIELCERRNLFTHTNGIVSGQYIKNCCDNKCNVSNIKIGKK